MRHFDWTQFTRKIAVEAPTKTIYDAWTIPTEIERWFLSDATFINMEGNKIPKASHINVGDTYQWQWHLWDITEMGKVTKVNFKDYIQFTFAGDCLVDVRLEPYDKGTVVSISQTNIPTDDESKHNVRLGCDSGWSFYLVNLKSIYEGGIDLRNKDKSLQPMINN